MTGVRGSQSPAHSLASPHFLIWGIHRLENKVTLKSSSLLLALNHAPPFAPSLEEDSAQSVWGEPDGHLQGEYVSQPFLLWG